jgi:hypothetical protein
MASLLDIAPLTETVSVRGQKVEVFGVSARGVALLLARFPDLRLMMTGRSVDTDRLMALGGEAVAAIIAAGCGSPGDEAAEAVAERLSIEDQAELLSSVLRLTLPNGIGPFVEKLTALGAVMNGEGARSPKAQASKSPSRSKN